jgi:hypothetical protein
MPCIPGAREEKESLSLINKTIRAFFLKLNNQGLYTSIITRFPQACFISRFSKSDPYNFQDPLHITKEDNNVEKCKFCSGYTSLVFFIEQNLKQRLRVPKKKSGRNC